MPGLIAALRAGIRYPVIEMRPEDAPTRLAAIQPAAVVVDKPNTDLELIETIVGRVGKLEGPYVPVLARSADGACDQPSVLPIAPDAAPARVVARLTSALRVRALHATVQRRAAAQDGNGKVASHRPGDAPEQPTVLVAGRGGGYPALTLAVGERAGLIGALGFETAQRYLDGRDIDGIVVGDGFSGRAVEGFLDTLRSDVRFRDLPIVVADSRIGPLDLDQLPNADRVRGGPDRVMAHLLPLVRLHAFGARLRRWAKSLESKGFVDADTGLLTCNAFVHDLNRAIADGEKRTGSLSLARFAFERIDRHTSLDAARIVGRLVRSTDFACQDDDGAIHIVFGETDLKAAHVVARRIASVLKHTMLVPDPDAPRLNPEVSLVMRKPSDTAETMLARVHPAAIAAE
ncbi:MAG: GGDEF domain-containing protein [Xanthobacteraceae bacterium]